MPKGYETLRQNTARSESASSLDTAFKKTVVDLQDNVSMTYGENVLVHAFPLWAKYAGKEPSEQRLPEFQEYLTRIYTQVQEQAKTRNHQDRNLNRLVARLGSAVDYLAIDSRKVRGGLRFPSKKIRAIYAKLPEFDVSSVVEHSEDLFDESKVTQPRDEEGAGKEAPVPPLSEDLPPEFDDEEEDEDLSEEEIRAAAAETLSMLEEDFEQDYREPLPKGWYERENESIRQQISAWEENIERLSRVELSDIMNMVDIKAYEELIKEVAGKSGRPTVYRFRELLPKKNPLRSPNLEKRFREVQIVESADATEGAGLALRVVSAYLPGKSTSFELLIDLAKIRREMRRYLNSISDTNPDTLEAARQYFMRWLQHGFMHELTHLASYSGSILKYEEDIEKEQTLGKGTFADFIGFRKDTRTEQTAAVSETEGKKSIDFAQGEMLKHDVLYNWLNEAVTERLTLEIHEEYARRRGETGFTPSSIGTRHALPLIEAYPVERQALDALIGYMAVQLEVDQDMVWRSVVQGFMSDPVNFISALRSLIKDAPEIAEWFRKHASASMKDAAVLVHEFRNLLEQANIPIDQVRATLALS